MIFVGKDYIVVFFVVIIVVVVVVVVVVELVLVCVRVCACVSTYIEGVRTHLAKIYTCHTKSGRVR